MYYIPFTELNVGFTNAENYRRRENKELLTKYFVRDEYLEQILQSNVYYVVGEKGTGKTAYATFLKNSEYKKNKISIYDVRQTEYLKFIELKRRNYLPLSQYSEVWRTLLLVTCAVSVIDHNKKTPLLSSSPRLKELKSAMDNFYNEAFSPELVNIINLIENNDFSASIMAKRAGFESGISARTSSEKNTTAASFQTNLMKIRKAFEDALTHSKLKENFIIFIDGIDVRPADIEYEEYFDCVRGLIEAVWSINTDFLSNIKDSLGRIRIVLLVRPDTFIRAGLHNLNTKLRDNSVFLNWSTTYENYRSSLLFKVADRLLSAQQNFPILEPGSAWDHYFPFYAENVLAESVSGPFETNAFIAFLRFSYYRPRDIASMIGTMQRIIKEKKIIADYVTVDDFNDSSFRDSHAEYLLGEIRDQLLFYYTQEEYDLFLQFFSHLRGKLRFSYDEFVEAYQEFVSECAAAEKRMPQFFETPNTFLQFLYELNVICYKERGELDDDHKPFIRWCFRERSLSNMRPKVRMGVDYEIFYGLSKALNIGKRVRAGKTNVPNLIGTIVSIDLKKKFGFLRGGEKHHDFYFSLTEYKAKKEPRVGQKVSFQIEVRDGRQRARNIKPTK